MLRGLWKLTWIEMKIFVREPLGLFGTLGMPVIVFLIISRVLGGRAAPAGRKWRASSASMCPFSRRC